MTLTLHVLAVPHKYVVVPTFLFIKENNTYIYIHFYVFIWQDSEG